MDLLAAELAERLVTAARAVCAHACAPASGSAVGAAVVAADGNFYRGCNVENASYGLTICAERAAVCAAVATGSCEPARPCGACRQVLAEFGRDMVVLLAGPAEPWCSTSLARLLPEPFTFGDLASS